MYFASKHCILNFPMNACMIDRSRSPYERVVCENLVQARNLFLLLSLTPQLHEPLTYSTTTTLAMLSLLRNYPGYTIASSIKLRPSVLHVATRHFLTTCPDHSPARNAAIIEPSIHESKKKSTDSKKGNLPAKPKRSKHYAISKD